MNIRGQDLRSNMAEAGFSTMVIEEKDLRKVTFGNMEVKHWTCDNASYAIDEMDEKINTFLAENPVYVIQHGPIILGDKLLYQLNFRRIKKVEEKLKDNAPTSTWTNISGCVVQ